MPHDLRFSACRRLAGWLLAALGAIGPWMHNAQAQGTPALVILAQGHGFRIEARPEQLQAGRCDGLRVWAYADDDDLFSTHAKELGALVTQAGQEASRRCPGLIQLNVTGASAAYEKALVEWRQKQERYVFEPYAGDAFAAGGWVLSGSAFDIYTKEPIPPRRPGAPRLSKDELARLALLAEHEGYTVSVNKAAGLHCHGFLAIETADPKRISEDNQAMIAALRLGVRALLARCPDLDTVVVNGRVPGHESVYTGRALKGMGWKLRNAYAAKPPLDGPSIGPSPCDGPASHARDKEPTAADLCRALVRSFDEEAEAYEKAGAMMVNWLGPLGKAGLQQVGSLKMIVTSFEKTRPCTPEGGGRLVCRYKADVRYLDNQVMDALQRAGVPPIYNEGAFFRDPSGAWRYDLTLAQKVAERDHDETRRRQEKKRERRVEECRDLNLGTRHYWSCN